LEPHVKKHIMGEGEVKMTKISVPNVIYGRPLIHTHYTLAAVNIFTIASKII